MKCIRIRRDNRQVHPGACRAVQVKECIGHELGRQERECAPGGPFR